MVLADNNVDSTELEALYKIGREQFHLTDEEINKVVLAPGVIYYPQSLEEKARYLFNLATIAWADGVITQEERDLLKFYAAKFGFEEKNLDDLVQFLLDEADPSANKTVEDILNIINN